MARTIIELERIVVRNVRTLMALRGFHRQTDFAAHMRIDVSRLSRKLNGSENWTLLDIQRTADALQVEPYELLQPEPRVIEPPGDGQKRSQTA